MATAVPFKISIPEEDLKRLKTKLSLTHLPSQLDGENNWEYGAPLTEIQRLAEYWANGFDWREAEAELNAMPQYRTKVQVDGFSPLDIHYVFQKSEVENAIPLLFLHGWPGSFIEVQKLLPLLKAGDGKPAYHVIAPSLPNFGFSSGVTDADFYLEQYAESMHRLMLSLGFNKYVTQSGDWGFFIARAMALKYPHSVLATHVNMTRGHKPTWSRHPLLALQHKVQPYSEQEKKDLARTRWFAKSGSAYRDLQATKPQTLGFALEDSPVALLAWVYEKLHDWTDKYPWTDDEILTWISIYWFSTAGPAASVRIYYTAAEGHHPPGIIDRVTVEHYVPHAKLGIAYFPADLTPQPRTWARTMGPVVYESEQKDGGHFAAWERPQRIAGDLNAMFGKGGPCYKIVAGRSGYKSKKGKL